MQNEIDTDFTLYIQEQNKLLACLPIEKINTFIQFFQDVRESGQTLWILGNGGSAATASHLVTDFSKGASENGMKPLKALAPSEFVSLQTAISNDIDFAQVYSKTLGLFAEAGDAILILSVSGRSPNLVHAAEFARRAQINVLSVVGERGTTLQDLSDICIMIPSNDYQIVENIQLTLGHWIMKQLKIDSNCAG
jgi:D-sedoheptulose 7-phosphate isomerase